VATSSFAFEFPLSSRTKRSVVGSFDAGRLSSDGGIVILREVEQKMQLISRLAACIPDGRQRSKVEQTVEDMLRQRVFGICLGYEDGNDFDTLAEDPLFKISVGRCPDSGRNLASQPTLSRFENSVDSKDLYRLIQAMVEHFVESHPTAKKIILDVDATDDPTHGQQEMEFYHGYYRSHCYLPLLVFATVDEDPEQHMLCAVLRPGNKHAGHGTVGVLKRIVARLQGAYPDARIVLRGDAGFARPAVYDYCETARLDYVLSLPKNARLLTAAEPLLKTARAESVATGQKARLFDDVSYAAKGWSHERRVVIKAEIMPKHGDNPRFVVTNIPTEEASANAIYEFYTDRGDAENRIKEMKDDLASGRTSCHRFVANQFRLILHAAAMILMQELRKLLDGTGMAHFQAGTLRVRLLKVGTRVIQTSRRIWLKLPTSFPYQKAWATIWERMADIPPPIRHSYM
jgi:hypothetical protein